MSERRYCVRPMSRHPAGAAGEILHLREEGDNVLLPRELAEAIVACAPFRTASAHARALALRFKKGSHELPELTKMVEAFAADGFLLSLEGIAEAAAENVEKSASITTVA